MAVNYDDKRFDQVQSDKNQAMTELEQTYAGMIGESDKYYQAQIDATKEWADKQQQIQQEQTDFAIQQVEQQKEQVHKDYIKEQSGAYVDWQKQSDQYGANAEQMAQGGMTNTGFSESSQVSMYNTYQNRVMTARESYNNAVLNYNNAIKDAQLQNSAVLAEIAFEALKTQLQLSLEGFQYKNTLILEQANKKVEMDNMYYQRYQDVLAQINQEKAMAEEIRQFNQNYQLQLDQLSEQTRQFNMEYNESVRQFNEEIARLKKKDAEEYALQIQQLELQKQQAAEQKRQFEKEMAFKQQQLAEEKRQFDVKNQTSSSSISGGGSSGGGSAKSSGNTVTKTSSGYNDALTYFNAMVASGSTKSQVLSEITAAQKAGQITAAEATKLRSIYNTKGSTY